MDNRKLVQVAIAGLNAEQFTQLQAALAAILDGNSTATQPKKSEPADAPRDETAADNIRAIPNTGFESLMDYAERELPGSRVYHSVSISSYGKFLGVSTPRVKDLSTHNLIAFHKWMLENYKATTVRQRFSAIRKLWRHAAVNSVVPFGAHDPSISLSDLDVLFTPRQNLIVKEVIASLSSHLRRQPKASDLTRANVLAIAKTWTNAGLAISCRKRIIEDFANFAGVTAPGIELRRTFKDQPDTYQGQQTIFAFLRDVYIPKRLLGPNSTNTVRLYVNTIRKFSGSLGRPAVLKDFTDENFARYLQGEFAAGLSPCTVEKEGVQLQCLWRFAYQNKLVDSHPELKVPVAPDNVPDAFLPEELDRLFSAAKAQAGLISNVPAGLWWQGLLSVIYDSGERIGAVLKIKWTDMQGDWLTVPPGNRKGGRQGKRFKLRPETLELLAQIKAYTVGELVFQWDKSYGYIFQIYGKLIESADLPNVRRGKFHKIRRTVATYYEAAGGNATQLLGHSSRKVTERYIDTRIAQTPQPADIVAPIIRKA